MWQYKGLNLVMLLIIELTNKGSETFWKRTLEKQKFVITSFPQDVHPGSKFLAKSSNFRPCLVQYLSNISIVIRDISEVFAFLF
jgi:hypothetical protein